jgi:2-keto-4-pentenoate hydratase
MEASAIENKIEKAAGVLFDAWQADSVINDLPADCKPTTIAEGHQIQNALVELLSRPVGGWKLAATSEAAQRANQLSGPIYGRLFKDVLLDAPADIDGANFHAPDIEGEFAFRMAADLSPRDAVYEAGEVADAVQSLHLAVEVANSRYLDHKIVGFPAIIADNGGTGALVIGPEVADWQSLDIPSVPVSINFDGVCVSGSFRDDARCKPLEALVWLANELSARGLALKAGDVVTTGTSSPPSRAGIGQVIEVVFEGLGTIEVHMV